VFMCCVAVNNFLQTSTSHSYSLVAITLRGFYRLPSSWIASTLMA
jgi:hypothetical protein